MKTVIKALLAASALLPVGAQAQNADWHGRGDRGEARAARGNYSGGAQNAASAPDAPSAAGASSASDVRSARPPGRHESAAISRPGRTGTSGSGPGLSGPIRSGAERSTRDLPGQAYQRQPDGSRDPYRGRGDAQPVAVTRSYDNGAGAVRRYQDDRRGVNHGNRGYVQTYGNRYEGRGGAWNRDWRRDDRYDYNGYRSYNQGAYRLPRYYAPSGYRRFGIGAVISSFLWNRDYWIDDPYAYRLPEGVWAVSLGSLL